jgi:hypothetical protein
VCGCPQDDGLLCVTCTERLSVELRDVPAIVTELDTTISKQVRMDAPGKGGLARERNPFDVDASIAAGALENTLTTWARDVIGDWITRPAMVYRSRDSKTPGPYCLTCRHQSCRAMRRTEKADPPPSIIAAHALLSEMPSIRKHPAAEEIVDNICSATEQARKDVDRAANRTRFPVGPCPEFDEDGAHCEGQVFAFIPTEDERPPRMECRANPLHRWTSVQWLRTGRRILDRMAQVKREVA